MLRKLGCAILTLFALVGADAAAAAEPAEDASMLVYFGTYTRGEGKGVYVSRFDPQTGKLTEPELAGEVQNPSFVAIHPSGKYLYAVGETATFNGKETGAVTAFAIDRESGMLEQLNRQSSGGAGPCHIVVDKAGRNVLVANYGGGSCASLPLGDDGRLKEPASVIQHEGSSADPQRQKGPHAHSINLDAANRFAFVADLGLDKVLVYRFDPQTGKLAPADPASASLKPRSGPRHFTFHPEGEFAYVINELASTMTAFRYDPESGKLEEIQTLSTLPDDFDGNNSTAEVRAHPSGRFLYGSNRGHDSIAVFSVDPRTGKLTAVEHEPTRGQTPRNFNIDPTGRFLLAANQATNTVAVFRIDQKTGELEAVGEPLPVPSPVCIRFLQTEGE
jgi:6-phosphogluconolactonase